MFYLQRVASALESALKRDRLIVAVSLGLIAALSWIVTARLALDMSWMALGTSGWTAGYFTAMFLMWVVMMVPSAAPAILLYAALQGDRRLRGTALFTAGYLAIWTAFSLVATIAQWGLAELGQLASPMMIRTTPLLDAALLFAAGAYQLTPWKHACLGKCRSPAAFLVGRWKPGRLGAFLMGIEHGAYCAGCCWALMALLFVAGAMNLLWVAALAVFVLAEKLLPAGVLIARASALLMLAGGALLVWGG